MRRAHPCAFNVYCQLAIADLLWCARSISSRVSIEWACTRMLAANIGNLNSIWLFKAIQSINLTQ